MPIISIPRVIMHLAFNSLAYTSLFVRFIELDLIPFRMPKLPWKILLWQMQTVGQMGRDPCPCWRTTTPSPKLKIWGPFLELPLVLLLWFGLLLPSYSIPTKISYTLIPKFPWKLFQFHFNVLSLGHCCSFYMVPRSTDLLLSLSSLLFGFIMLDESPDKASWKTLISWCGTGTFYLTK